VPSRVSRKRWIIAAAAAAAAIVTTAIVVVAIIGLGPGPTTPTPHKTSTTPTPTVAPDRLDSILLSAPDVNSIMGDSGMQLDGPIVHAPYDLPGTVSNLDCLGTLFPNYDPVYRGSGYTAIIDAGLIDPANIPSDNVDQAAVSFPSADLALVFLKNSAVKWKACAGQAVNITVNGQTDRWTIGDLTGDVPTITQTHTLEGGGGYVCQHQLSVVSNLVIDVNACSHHISDQARQIADKMAAKVAQ
jgi:hypothetical protein